MTVRPAVAAVAATLLLPGCGVLGAEEAATQTVGVEATTTLPRPTIEEVVTQTGTRATVTVTVAPQSTPSPPTTPSSATSASTTPASGTASPTATPATVTVTSPAAPSSSTVSSSSTCGTDTAAQARSANVGKVPANPATEWDTSVSEGLEGYDPCAALSYIVLGVKGATASSPFAIMLFHRGDYLGRASAVNFGFYPATVRLSDSTIRVTYTYARPGEPNAGASGRAVSTFRWDEGQQKVIQSGQWPPH